MLWTWVLVVLLAGEFLFYFILVALRRWLPYRGDYSYISMALFYILCLGLFVMAGVSFFSYSDMKERLKRLDVIYSQITDLDVVRDSILLMESSQKVFLITGKQDDLVFYSKVREMVDKKLSLIKKSYEDIPDQRLVGLFCDLVKSKLLFLDKGIDVKKKERFEDIGDVREGRKIMDMVLMAARELEDWRRGEYKKVMSGLWSLNCVMVYTSFVLMVAALVNVVIAGILGRSKIPT